MPRALGIAAGALLAAAIIAGGAWLASWTLLAPRPQTAGRLAISGLQGPVSVVRDARGFPYVSARSLHDAYEAQGYLEGEDRLFQMDVLRRFVGGRLAEVFGPQLLSVDVRHRMIGPEQMAQRMYQQAAPEERAALDAFAQGVNAAMRRDPLPPEFRALLYRPRPWRPQDSLLCGLATVIDLTHTWSQVALRARIDARVGSAAAAALYSITDPRYDAPLVGRPAPVPTLPPFPSVGNPARSGAAPPIADTLPWRADREASNAWAVGGAHTRSGRALLANDPHLDFTVPMVWYAIALHAPGLNVVGASLPGTPGVILGHGAHIAWGATNATVSTLTLYREHVRETPKGFEVEDARTHAWIAVVAQTEQIAVRGARAHAFERLRTPHGFLLLDGQGRLALPAYAAAWVAQREAHSPLAAFLALDRAGSLESALAALRAYPGPPQNFVLADDRGRVAYHLAGLIPVDGVWGTRAVDGSRIVDAWRGYVPFDQLPHVDPSRDAVVFTANNRVYGAGYPYRLTDAFGPPYRAYRIRELLTGRDGLTDSEMERLQLDDLSLPELELVRDVLAAAARHPGADEDPRTLERLRAWDGRFDANASAATLAYRL
ncbi:MAG: penicillin acylase family protein, partial [bacterium]|nr:penicillin acylase family protein [bacterium]